MGKECLCSLEHPGRQEAGARQRWGTETTASDSVYTHAIDRRGVHVVAAHASSEMLDPFFPDLAPLHSGESISPSREESSNAGVPVTSSAYKNLTNIRGVSILLFHPLEK